ncbi:MAG: hypothetical protein ABFR95_10450, partial [Actinomycetota bacterium]
MPPTSAETTTDAVDDDKKPRGWRRSLYIAIAILLAFVVYAFAFAKTDVSLDQIQSEQRQEQLFAILRALAKPDLIHYDKDDLVVTADVYVPCNGTEPAGPTPDPSGAAITVSPTCAAPGETMTVSGTGYEPGTRAIVNFVPISDFVIVLKQGIADVGDDGTFTLSFPAPERENAEPQQVEVITQKSIGSWTNRVSVWTDTNVNGIEDAASIPDTEDGLAAFILQLPEFELRDPGGMTIIDENNNVLDFVSWGGSFEATTGSGTGHVSRDIGIDPFKVDEASSVQLTGTGVSAEDFDWAGPVAESFGTINEGQEATDTSSSLFFNEISFDDIGRIEIAGQAGASVKGASLVFFDAADGKQYKIVKLADTSDLSPRLSDNALNTWDRIVETVMLALLATTVGTFLAVPLSFMAAKNLMRDVTVPVVNLSLSLIALPIGLAIGTFSSGWASALQAFADANAFTLLLALALIGGLIWLLLRWTFPPEETHEQSDLQLRVLRVVALLTVGFLMLIGSYMVADLLVEIGEFLKDLIPGALFIGSFIVTLGEITTIGIPVVSALIGAFVVALAASKLGYYLDGHLGRGPLNAITLVASAIAGAVVGIGIGGVVDWFYQLENPLVTMIIPGLIGAAIGAFLSVKAIRKAESQNIGLTVYYLSRTVFNGLRSIEPLVMVIIFVVW